MKAKILLDFLKELSSQDLEKEITFLDFKTNVSYPSLSKPIIADLSDENYLDFVFNIEEEDLEPKKVDKREDCQYYKSTFYCKDCPLPRLNICLLINDSCNVSD